MMEALETPPTSPMKHHLVPFQLLSHLSENLCPSATLHRTPAYDPGSNSRSLSLDRPRAFKYLLDHRRGAAGRAFPGIGRNYLGSP